MSNFLFLQKNWPGIYQEAAEAEALTFSSPKACAMMCRSALEKAVRSLYANDPDLTEPYDTRLAALMHEQCLQNILKPSMFREINLVRKLGNNAAHGESIRQDEALVAIKNLKSAEHLMAAKPVRQRSPKDTTCQPDRESCFRVFRQRGL